MQLIAKKREILGKKTKYIRRNKEIPAVIFGKGMESVNISLDYNNFDKTFKQAGETDLIDIVAGDDKFKVLVKDMHMDPVSDKISHVGFYKPDLTIRTEAQVPVEVVGEENNELVKGGEALALQLLQEITVEALPEDIPHSFIVDISNINEVGQGVTISQLDYDREKVTIPDLDPEEMVVRVDEVIIEEEPEEEVVSEEEAIAGVEATEEKEEGEEGEEAMEEKNQG
ncbi:50S ribosomal protein L25 [Patescibacteria group bacterium]|nr:50S ribosomal protein L25 [Patescibacteria group bacterium]